MSSLKVCKKIISNIQIYTESVFKLVTSARCIPCFCRNSTLTAKDSNSSGMLHVIADKLCVLLDNYKEKILSYHSYFKNKGNVANSSHFKHVIVLLHIFFWKRSKQLS